MQENPAKFNTFYYPSDACYILYDERNDCGNEIKITMAAGNGNANKESTTTSFAETA